MTPNLLFLDKCRVLALRQKLELRSAHAPTRKIGAALRSRSGIKSESAAPLPLRARMSAAPNCAPVGKKFLNFGSNLPEIFLYSNILTKS